MRFLTDESAGSVKDCRKARWPWEKEQVCKMFAFPLNFTAFVGRSKTKRNNNALI